MCALQGMILLMKIDKGKVTIARLDFSLLYVLLLILKIKIRKGNLKKSKGDCRSKKKAYFHFLLNLL